MYKEEEFTLKAKKELSITQTPRVTLLDEYIQKSIKKAVADLNKLSIYAESSKKFPRTHHRK